MSPKLEKNGDFEKFYEKNGDFEKFYEKISNFQFCNISHFRSFFEMFSRRINFAANYTKSWKISKSQIFKKNSKILKSLSLRKFSQIRTWACSRTCLGLASTNCRKFPVVEKDHFYLVIFDVLEHVPLPRVQITNSAWFLSVISNGPFFGPLLPRSRRKSTRQSAL